MNKKFNVIDVWMVYKLKKKYINFIAFLMKVQYLEFIMKNYHKKLS